MSTGNRSTAREQQPDNVVSLYPTYVAEFLATPEGRTMTPEEFRFVVPIVRSQKKSGHWLSDDMWYLNLGLARRTFARDRGMPEPAPAPVEAALDAPRCIHAAGMALSCLPYSQSVELRSRLIQEVRRSLDEARMKLAQIDTYIEGQEALAHDAQG